MPIDEGWPLLAVRISLDRSPAMAAAMIYAAAHVTEANLITSDAHFQRCSRWSSSDATLEAGILNRGCAPNQDCRGQSRNH